MKVLIWFFTIFIFLFLNTLLGVVTGIKVGYLLIWIPICFISKFFCKAWDNRKVPKYDASANVKLNIPCEKSEALLSPDPNPIPQRPTSSIVYCRKCGYKLLPDSAFCSKCGTKVLVDDE